MCSRGKYLAAYKAMRYWSKPCAKYKAGSYALTASPAPERWPAWPLADF